MTVVNPKSISGINSITMASGSDNLLTIHTTNTTERVRINSSGDVIVGSGITVSPDGDIFTTGVTTSTTFVGALTGNVTGNVTGNISGGTVAGSTGTFTGNVAVSGANITLQDSGSSSDDRITLGASADFMMYHDGTYNWFDAVNNHDTLLRAGTAGLYLQGGVVYIGKEGASEYSIKAVSDGAVELYHDGTKMIETISTGTNIPDGKFAKFGNSNDMSMGHNTYNYITYTGADFLITGDSTNQIKLQPKSDEAAIICKPNAEVELFHDGSLQCETSANGLAFPSGKGIDFSATGGGDLGGTGSSELLDDYEEGTCLFTFVPASGSYGYVYRTGHYTKIGDIVHVTGSISVNGHSSASGEVQISGLPFSVRGVNSTWSGEGGHGVGRWHYGGPNHYNFCVCNNSTDRILVHKADGTYLNHSNMNTAYNASQFSFTVTYFHA